MSALYSLLYPLVYGPLVYGLAWCLAPFSRKIRAGLLGRRQLVARLSRAGLQRPYWFHIASSGELEQCLPILDSLRAARPEACIFISYFSPTARRALELEKERREKAGVAVPWSYADFSPFDFARSVDEFLDCLRPLSFVAIHREIWPVLIRRCQARGIPCFLFASFFPKSAQRGFARYQSALEGFRFIGTVESESTRFLSERLPGIPIETLGDPRVERVLGRRKMLEAPAWSRELAERKVFLAASLWPRDAQALDEALRLIHRDFPDWQVVLVPHEPGEAFLRELESRLAAAGITSRRWSQWVGSLEPGVALLVDTVGILAELYRVASLVFVGGSFKGRVHNVLEPAAYGCPILTGPFIQNSAEALCLEREDRGLWRSRNADELAGRLKKLLEDEPTRARYSRSLEAYLVERSGASGRYLSTLLEELKS